MNAKYLDLARNNAARCAGYLELVADDWAVVELLRDARILEERIMELIEERGDETRRD